MTFRTAFDLVMDHFGIVAEREKFWKLANLRGEKKRAIRIYKMIAMSIVCMP